MRAAEKILARMVELAKDPASGWEAVPGLVGATVRFTKTETTPDYARSSERGAWHALWDSDTYDMHVFITLVAGKVIMRASTAPWVSSHDSSIPFWLAEAVLADAELGWDSPRQWRLKADRKAGTR